MSDLTVDSTAREHGGGDPRQADLRPRAARPPPGPDRRAQPRAERDRVSLDEERAREGAAAADEAIARGDEVGPLHGLPHAFKDTHDVAGWRTTYGSPLYADHVPDADTLLVERIRNAGVVTDRQDQRAGVRGRVAHVQPGLRHHPQPGRPDAAPPAGRPGERRARWRPAWCRSPTAPTWAARCATPRRFCGVVGLRPSIGRVPDWPTESYWDNLSTGGPMARNVGDLALLLSVMAGPDRRTPFALGDPGATFAPAARRHPQRPPGRAVDRPRRRLRRRRRGRRRGRRRPPPRSPPAGPSVARTHPDLSLADDVFRTLRAWQFQAAFGDAARRAPRRRSSSRSPTTSAPASRSPAPTSPAPSSGGRR